MLRKSLILSVLSFGLLVAFSSFLAAKPDVKASAEGRKLFMQYCVTCHGTDAKGTGPTAKLLKKAPADLTKVEKENGKFPFTRIERTISGADMPDSHGSREMPVWGPYLRRKSGPGFATLEIYNLTKYIESIQQ